jgi:electron transfer flavoprotein alpha subunit
MASFSHLRQIIRPPLQQVRLSSRQAAARQARYASTHALVFLEHSNGAVEPASLSALAAASQLGSGENKVTGIIVGSKEEVDKILPRVKK